jgi:GMP synthase-like glutamine amidotransferase
VKPIAIFQHEADAPPAYFETWLREQSLPSVIVRIDRGDPVPADPHRFSGLCFMGGAMSVNDPLRWIDEECALIRAADRAGLPVIGHCLGGQLLAKALGAEVTRNPVKELGWQRLQVTDVGLAREWLGADAVPEAEWFQWHGDTFALPAGARNFLASALCANQAYVIQRDGFAHLGMQFHCEMTPALIEAWVGADGQREIDEERASTGGPGVQTPAAICDAVEARAALLSRLAARLYARWAEGLAPEKAKRRA